MSAPSAHLPLDLGAAAPPCSVTLPWPPRQLNPNERVHWSVRRKHAKAYREACYMLARQARLAVDWAGDVHLWLDFYPPDRRSRDDDNMIAAFKAGRDGLADALGLDDARFRIHPYVCDEVGGMVKVKLTPGPLVRGEAA